MNNSVSTLDIVNALWGTPPKVHVNFDALSVSKRTRRGSSPRASKTLSLWLAMVILIPLLGLAACVPTVPALSSTEQALALDPATPWARHTIRTGASGADGVAHGWLAGQRVVASAWEESSTVALSFAPADVTQPWPTVTWPHGSAEAVALVDVDGDGLLDVVSGGQDKKLRIRFAPTDPTQLQNAAVWTTVVIGAATNVQYWMAVAAADVDGDGPVELLAGGRVAYPAGIDMLSSPTPRIATSWIRTRLGSAGWLMSLLPRDLDGDGDVDIIVSDRDRYQLASGGPWQYDLRGSRWLEQTPAGWVNRPIGYAGTGYGHRMIGDGGSYVIDCATTGTTSELVARSGWGSTATALPYPANVGQCHATEIGDIDRDGHDDLAVTFSDASTTSGVVWLRGPTWERYEISGPDGTKFDDIVLIDLDSDGDLDAITSEQTENLGVVWYENPTL